MTHTNQAVTRETDIITLGKANKRPRRSNNHHKVFYLTSLEIGLQKTK